MTKRTLFQLILVILMTVCFIYACSDEEPKGQQVVPDASAGIGTFSRGQRMGQLTKVSVKGIMNKSTEGQLNLGREGTPYVIVSGSDDDKTEKRINPWYFSAAAADIGKFNNYVGEYVVITYNQAHIANVMKYDTDYYATSVTPITREYPFSVYESPKGKPEGGNVKSHGQRAGRIVKASFRGTVEKTYEIMIQQGNAGNQFKHMSCMSDAMYNKIVEALNSGKPYKIYYAEYKFNLRQQETAYEIWKLEKPGNDI